MREYLELFISFFKIGLLTFGGGYAMLPMLTKETVEKHHWVSDEELLDYFAVGQCTPGVIAVNTATFIGKKQKGIPGAVFTTIGVVMPSFMIICLIAAILLPFMDNPYVIHALAGIRVIVCALIMNSVLSMGKKSVKNIRGIIFALAALVLSFFKAVPTVVIVLIAAASGILCGRFRNNGDRKGDSV